VQTLFVFFVILAQTFKKGTLNIRISQELISFIFALLETNILVRQQWNSFKLLPHEWPWLYSR